MSPNLLIYIIILNWNRPDDTKACIKSIEKSVVDNFNYEIVVVDNGSTDDSVTQFRKLGVKLIENKQNLGFAAGNNEGIKYALKNKADYVLVLNNDTIVDKNLIAELVKAARENPKAGILTPKIYFAKGYEFHSGRYKKSDVGKVIWSAGGEIDWKNVYASNRGVDQVDKGQFDHLSQTDFATGACSLFNSGALRKVRLYNESYFMYLEDLELSVRMKKKNWQILYVPKAVLWHKVAQSSGIGSGLNDYYITRNRLLFGLKYASIRAKIALIRESFRLLRHGRIWQRVGARDFYLNILGRGSFR